MQWVSGASVVRGENNGQSHWEGLPRFSLSYWQWDSETSGERESGLITKNWSWAHAGASSESQWEWCQRGERGAPRLSFPFLTKTNWNRLNVFTLNCSVPSQSHTLVHRTYFSCSCSSALLPAVEEAEILSSVGHGDIVIIISCPDPHKL